MSTKNNIQGRRERCIRFQPGDRIYARSVIQTNDDGDRAEFDQQEPELVKPPQGAEGQVRDSDPSNGVVFGVCIVLVVAAIVGLIAWGVR